MGLLPAGEVGYPDFFSARSVFLRPLSRARQGRQADLWRFVKDSQPCYDACVVDIVGFVIDMGGSASVFCASAELRPSRTFHSSDWPRSTHEHHLLEIVHLDRNLPFLVFVRDLYIHTVHGSNP